MEDLAGAEYWDGVWADATLPPDVDPSDLGLRNYVDRRLAALVSDLLGSGEGVRTLLELGCGRSRWLPYFGRNLGYQVTGIDYSAPGCQQARQLLARASIDGEVVCADFFSPPDRLLGGFDVVFSAGVAEHFTDTAQAIAAFSRFLRPGGTILTSVPNMAGAIGYVQQVVNRPVYELHVPLDVPSLVAAHADAGLEVLRCEYFLPANFGVCNLAGLREKTLSWWLKRGSLTVLFGVSVLTWALENIGFPWKPTRLMSPYVWCLARKPVDQSDEHLHVRRKRRSAAGVWTPSDDQRFTFGRNWGRFLTVLDGERISTAEKTLADHLARLGLDDLHGVTFLDVGSGSGLFSLAARRLGATVRSIDNDAASVACTAALRAEHFPEDASWIVEHGSALDSEYLARLGQFDVVYAWGVLHHTGHLWQALENMVPLVSPRGVLWIAVYNDQGRRTACWLNVKRLYNRLPSKLRHVVLVPSFLWLWGPRILRDSLQGKPSRAWRMYGHNRGMSLWTDLIDWVGGYPFEVAKPEELFRFLKDRGFTLEHMRTAGGGLGNNEMLFAAPTESQAEASTVKS